MRLRNDVVERRGQPIRNRQVAVHTLETQLARPVVTLIYLESQPIGNLEPAAHCASTTPGCPSRTPRGTAGRPALPHEHDAALGTGSGREALTWRHCMAKPNRSRLRGWRGEHYLFGTAPPRLITLGALHRAEPRGRFRPLEPRRAEPAAMQVLLPPIPRAVLARIASPTKPPCRRHLDLATGTALLG